MKIETVAVTKTLLAKTFRYLLTRPCGEVGDLVNEFNAEISSQVTPNQIDKTQAADQERSAIMDEKRRRRKL